MCLIDCKDVAKFVDGGPFDCGAHAFDDGKLINGRDGRERRRASVRQRDHSK